MADKRTVNIHGKEYETVASRVQKFREEHGDKYGITTELISADKDVVVMKACIREMAGNNGYIATGHAEERRDASTINRTSALENCETSAIGRALAAFGLAGTEFASADEVAQAISQQDRPTAVKSAYQNPQAAATDKQKQLIAKKLSEQGITLEDQSGWLIEQMGVELPLNMESASFVIENLIGS